MNSRGDGVEIFTSQTSTNGREREREREREESAREIKRERSVPIVNNAGAVTFMVFFSKIPLLMLGTNRCHRWSNISSNRQVP